MASALAIFGLALLAAGALGAAPVSGAVRAAAGSWLLSDAGGKVACTLDLTEDASDGRMVARAPFACRQAFPPLLGLAAWSLDDKGEIVLSDAAGKPIAIFAGSPGGGYEAHTASGGLWRLAPRPRPAARADERTWRA